MGRTHNSRYPKIPDFTAPVPIENGGTSKDTDYTGVKAIGGYHISEMNQPNALVKRGSNTLVPEEVIDPTILSAPTLEGTVSVKVGTSSAFKITNYNTFISYTLTAENGSATRSGDTVTFNALGTTGPATIILNQRRFKLSITP